MYGFGGEFLEAVANGRSGGCEPNTFCDDSPEKSLGKGLESAHDFLDHYF